VENEVICGFVTTGPSQDSDLPDVGELWAIYVDPQYWGKGVGRLLVTAGRDQMRRSAVSIRTHLRQDLVVLACL
jgi:GNAT superfamily N-acetyltransferase